MDRCWIKLTSMTVIDFIITWPYLVPQAKAIAEANKSDDVTCSAMEKTDNSGANLGGVEAHDAATRN